MGLLARFRHGGNTIFAPVLGGRQHFGDLQDPRSRTPAHYLTEMLVVALCAILCGADRWVAIQTWGEPDCAVTSPYLSPLTRRVRPGMRSRRTRK